MGRILAIYLPRAWNTAGGHSVVEKIGTWHHLLMLISNRASGFSQRTKLVSFQNPREPTETSSKPVCM